MQKRRARKRKWLNPRQKRILKRKLYIYSSASLLALLFAAFVYLSSIPGINIQKIKVLGDKNLAWNVQKLIHEEIFKDDYLFLPGNNALLLNKSRLSTAVLFSYPQIKDLNFKKTRLDELNLELKVRQPFFLFCKKNGECFLADKEGFIYARDDKAKNSLTKVYSYRLDKSSDLIIKDLPLRASLPSEDFSLLIKIKEILRKNNLRVKEIYFNADGQIKIVLDNFYIKAHKKDLAELKNMTYLIKNLNEKEIEELDYVDLRFKDRIYYKFKEDDEEGEEDLEQ